MGTSSRCCRLFATYIQLSLCCPTWGVTVRSFLLQSLSLPIFVLLFHSLVIHNLRSHLRRLLPLHLQPFPITGNKELRCCIAHYCKWLYRNADTYSAPGRQLTLQSDASGFMDTMIAFTSLYFQPASFPCCLRLASIKACYDTANNSQSKQ